MGRPKDSTVFSDSKIINALLYKPRRFSEFERALIEENPVETPDDIPEDAKIKNPYAWKRYMRAYEKIWRIPRKTLARRLKVLVAKGWVTRIVLPEHGHHVEYRLNFSKREEMLKELPLPKLHLTRSQIKLMRKIDAIVPLKEEIPKLDKLSSDEVLEVFSRLRSGEFVCPTCLEKGEGKKALNVSKDVDGRLYCRNCGEEVSSEECENLLAKVIEIELSKKLHKSMKEILQFFDAIDKQLEKTNDAPSGNDG